VQVLSFRQLAGVAFVAAVAFASVLLNASDSARDVAQPARSPSAARDSAPTSATSSAWPGLWGPSRSGVVPSLASPARGVKELWRRPSAGGYSEVTVVANRAVTLELRDGIDVVIALDAATGRELWSTRIGPTYKGHDGSVDGPIATAAIDGDAVFAVGPHGVIVALELATGRERWRHDLRTFGADMPQWGFAGSALVEDRHVIVPTGGPKSRGLLAFDRTTGRLAWSALPGGSVGYSSAIGVTLHGTRQIVLVRGDRIAAVSPANGEELWSVPGLGRDVEMVNSAIALPDNQLLLTHATESWLLSIARPNGRWTPTIAWKSPRLRVIYGPTIHHAGSLYGMVDEQLICLDPATGDVRWRERIGRGALAAAGSQLFVLHEHTGDLSIVDASPSGYRATARVRVFTPNVQSVTGPSIANGRLYIRNPKEIAAFELSPAS
jgi:outer membrane protein assembly factor BamB